MHLCEPCQAICDWDTDPVVKARIDRNLQQADPGRKAVCATCRVPIRNPMFQICARCAEQGHLCQHCSKSTLTPEQLAAVEEAAAKRDELIDLFTLSVKTYGLSVSRDMFHAMRDTFSDMAVDMLLALDHRDIDYGRELRPIWTKALGKNVFRFRWCAECSAVPRRAPAIIKAELCGHWTTLRSPAYCPVCAADKDACETCGIASD